MKLSALGLLTCVAANAFQPTEIKAPFLEQFTDDWSERWITSKAKKVMEGIEDEQILAFRGEWDVEEPTVVGIEGDKGLVLKTAAAHHAISAVFDKPIDPTGKPLVIQYEVQLQNSLECGGAYLKLLTHDESFVAEKLHDKTPYTIMFGPDKCGSNNKVHFIFRHKNPITGEYEEKHLTSPPLAKTDKKTNLYTLAINPDNSFEMFINQESVKKGSLLDSFEPPVNPPKEIDDPEDKKPADWVDEAKIADPSATKPEDWDEDAPARIVDEDAKKPEDWLEDEPTTIPDPSEKKPEDWDDEEDGDWVASSIPNPACEKVSGCGPWTAPTKPNPAYKGKWSAPMIDNPAYKGVWAPRKIANPNYYEDKNPANLNPIGAVGFELWTLQNDILFDNIYIGDSLADAKKLAAESWAIKFKTQKIEEPEPVKETESYLDKAKTYLNNLKDESEMFIEKAKKDPIAAVKELPHIASLITLIALIPILFLIPEKKKTDKKVVEKVEKKEQVSDDEEEEEEEEKPKVRKSPRKAE